MTHRLYGSLVPFLLVIPTWKEKGDHQDCSDYLDITLLSVLGKKNQ